MKKLSLAILAYLVLSDFRLTFQKGYASTADISTTITHFSGADLANRAKTPDDLSPSTNWLVGAQPTGKSFNQEDHWVRVEVNFKNKGEYVLRIGYAALDFVDFWLYELTPNQKSLVFENKSGNRIRAKAKAMSDVGFAYPINANVDNANFIAYLKITSKGQIQVPITITEKSLYYENYTKRAIVQWALIGSLVAILLYNLFVFASVKNRTYFYYCIYVFASVMASISLFGWGFTYFWPDYPEINKTMWAISFTLLYLSSLLYTINFLELPKISRFFYRVYQIAFGYFFISALLAFTLLSSFRGQILMLGGGILSLLALTVGISLFRRSRNVKFFLAASGSAALIGGLSTYARSIAWSSGIIDQQNLLLLAFFCQVVIFSLALADQLNLLKRSLQKSNQSLKNLNDNLEKIVQEKIRDIKALLDHIPQGVLVLGENGLLTEDYSANAPLILEDKNIVGNTLEALLLEKSTLNKNERDQITEVLTLSLGEDTIVFEANGSLLPEEITINSVDGNEKICELTWDTFEDADGIVDKILITIRDVTAARRLQAQVEEERKKIDLVKQLVDCGFKKFQKFYKQSSDILATNRKLTQALENEAGIRPLYANLHTIKGIARTFGFREASDEIHKAESFYTSISNGSEALDTARILEDLDKIEAVLSDYKELSDKIMGTSTEESSLSLDEGDFKQFISRLKQFLNTKMQVISEKQFIEEKIDQYLNPDKKPLSKALCEIITPLLEIAKDLGKPIPKLRVDAPTQLVSSKLTDTLEKLMVHLLRNAMDHGIETEQERLAAGKNEQGTIAVKALIEGENLTIDLSDDGRGLAIEKIHQKGIAQGKLNQDANIHEVAELIFDSGTSTAESITQISGRGVGMDAVRQFAREIGGDVVIELGKPKSDRQDFYNFTLQVKLPLMTDEYKQAS